MTGSRASSDETGWGARWLTHAVLWSRDHRRGLLVVVFLSIATAFVLDLLVPGYAIAGFYLVPLLIAAFALRGRVLIALIGSLCLALTVLAVVLQDRADAQNILLIGFGALAGLGIIALGHLFNRFASLYRTESATTARLQSLTTQLQRLQEMSVLDTDRPLTELLDYITQQAMQLLEGDACVLFRYDADRDLLSPQATTGIAPDVVSAMPVPPGREPAGEVVKERRPAAITDLRLAEDADVVPDASGDWIRGHGACIAVPLEAAADFYGVLAICYRQPRPFSEEEVRLAQSFGANAALAIENGRLREQLERGAAEAERSRLARDLHDSVTQALFTASIQAETLHSRWRPDSEEARRSLEDVHRLTRGALAEMRSLLLEMRPGALGQTPLPDLLRHLVDSAAARSDTAVSRSLGDLPSLPPDVTVALYRIAQEAMNNVVHHSRATRAWLTVEQRDGVVELVVGDDGRGFEDSAPPGPEHMGLQIMRERAAAIGAALEVGSAEGRGTVVTARWSGEGAEA
jgi:signal transduction histidine kinase